MRVDFKHQSQADRHLKTCKRILAENLVTLTEDAHLPSQRIRNSFCKGFGFSSYTELSSIVKQTGREYHPPSPDDLLTRMHRGFTLALCEAKEHGFTHHEPTNDNLARRLAEQALKELQAWKPVSIP